MWLFIVVSSVFWTNSPLFIFVSTQPLWHRKSNQCSVRVLFTSGVKFFKQALNLHIPTDILIPVFSFSILILCYYSFSGYIPNTHNGYFSSVTLIIKQFLLIYVYEITNLTFNEQFKWQVPYISCHLNFKTTNWLLGMTGQQEIKLPVHEDTVWNGLHVNRASFTEHPPELPFSTMDSAHLQVTVLHVWDEVKTPVICCYHTIVVVNVSHQPSPVCEVRQCNSAGAWPRTFILYSVMYTGEFQITWNCNEMSKMDIYLNGRKDIFVLFQSFVYLFTPLDCLL